MTNYRRVADARDPALGNSLATYSYEHEVEAGNIIFGSPATCISTIKRWRESLGLNAISTTMHFGGMPKDMAIDSIKRFASEVIPAFPD